MFSRVSSWFGWKYLRAHKRSPVRPPPVTNEEAVKLPGSNLLAGRRANRPTH
jgi:hypothetical protein